MLELAQRLRLDLADALARHVELLADDDVEPPEDYCVGGYHRCAPGDVLDGAIDPFISAALAQRVTGEAVEVEDVE